MYLAIDWGKKRIGLALGTIFPKGAGVLDGAESQEKIIEQIQKIIEENKVDKVVIGLPTLPSGDESDLATDVRAFGAKLTQMSGLPVDYESEEYTSLEATAQLQDKKIKYTRASGRVDELAAVLILEQYISHNE